MKEKVNEKKRDGKKICKEEAARRAREEVVQWAKREQELLVREDTIRKDIIR